MTLAEHQLGRHIYKADCKNHFFTHGFDGITGERKHWDRIFVYIVYAFNMEGLTRILMGITCNYPSVLYISIICVIRNSMHLAF